MSKVIFYTPAYNAEKTLRCSVDSVLAQTHADFLYYLLDNGSADGTRKIVEEYAARDSRIHPLYNEINWSGNKIADVMKNHSDDTYLCQLDADDEYTPDFLEKMLSFIDEYDLEVAACGNYFIDARTNKITGARMLLKNLILEGDGFGAHFSDYYQFMRTIWGKVYSLSVLRKCDFNYKTSIPYGDDTQFVMAAFKNAERVGILSEPLHKYYVSPKSLSSQFDEKRIISDQILSEVNRDYLISKCGLISEENQTALYKIYLYAIRDTMKVLTNSQIDVTEKLTWLRSILTSSYTQEVVRWHGAGAQKTKLFRQYAVWVLSQKEVYSSDWLEVAADILAAIGMYPSKVEDREAGWVFLLLANIKDRLTDQSLLEGIETQIVTAASESSLLAGLDAGFLIFFRDITFSVLQQDEKTALRQIEVAIEQETDMPDEYIESFMALGLQLSTKLEYAEDFIFLKKLQVSLLIDLSKPERAREELADWDELLPNDSDFKAFRKRLAQ